MPRLREATKRRIVDAAYELFWRQGFSRASVDEISAAAGITKRTFYSHFESKDLLLQEVLETQNELALAAFQSFGDQLTGSGEAIVEELFRGLDGWSADPRWTGSGYTRLVVELADLPGHPARKIAKSHKSSLEKHLADVLEDAGIADPAECARELWLLIEGTMVSILIHGDRDYIKRATRAGKLIVSSRQ
jgi:AcrR family transcriptional regulator